MNLTLGCLEYHYIILTFPKREIDRFLPVHLRAQGHLQPFQLILSTSFIVSLLVRRTAKGRKKEVCMM